MNHCLSLQN